MWHEHASNGIAHDTISAPLWKYVSLFAVIYYAGVLLAGTVIEYFDIKRASSIGNAIIFVAAFVIGRRFVARHKRIFTSSEAHRLMFYCLVVVTSMEAVVVFFHPDLQGTLSVRSSIIALAITIALNAFAVWVAYRFVARKDMQNRLKTMAPGAA